MQANNQPSSPISSWLQRTTPVNFSSYCIFAAFCTYFCMYAFRKPFTAGEFSDVTMWGVGYKTILIASQVAGYTISKFVGIKVISEMPAKRRAVAIIVLIAVAELALLLFAMIPSPYNFPLLFINGLPLGMVFGLVLSFLEGRQVTEALTAGLCASFIVASGVVKTVGSSLVVYYGVSEYWMPFLTGLIFLGPLILGVLLLSQIPKPNAEDIEQRSERKPMNRADRRAFFRRHAFGLSGLLIIYILLTIVRSIRDDFAVEIWSDMGHADEPTIFAKSEFYVMLGVVLINGLAILIRNNRAALLGAMALILGGFGLVLGSLWGQQSGALSPFVFMVMIGLGTYIPYVAFHTTIFERLIAAFRENGNIGYLMYLADATGYLGYVAVMTAKNYVSKDLNFLELFMNTTFWISIAATIIAMVLVYHYYRTIPHQSAVESTATPASETP
jgi:hypothetical protein